MYFATNKDYEEYMSNDCTNKEYMKNAYNYAIDIRDEIENLTPEEFEENTCGSEVDDEGHYIVYRTYGGPTCWVDLTDMLVCCHYGYEECEIDIDQKDGELLREYFFPDAENY